MVVGKERGSREKGRGMWDGESEEKTSRCGVRDSTGKCKWEGKGCVDVGRKKERGVLSEGGGGEGWGRRDVEAWEVRSGVGVRSVCGKGCIPWVEGREEGRGKVV